MVCAHCGADLAASQGVCHRCGYSADAAGALTSVTPPVETPTPLPAGSDVDDVTIAPVSERSHTEPDTHARPAVISGDQPTVGTAGAAPVSQGSATSVFQTG